MAFEFFQDGLFLFDEYTFNQLDNNETISGTYNLDVQVKDKIYQAKFAIIINVDCKNLTKIPEVYLPKLSIPFKFEHIYKDRKNLCCLGLNYEIELAWGPKRSFSNFLTLVVDPFLVNYLEFKENKKYINGERPHAKNGLIDYDSQFFTSISTNNCVETPKIIISSLNQVIKEKLEIITNNNFSNDFCVFGLGPQYFFINLGYKLSDKTNYLIYTKHRDKWILDQPIKNINEFSLIKPQITKSNEVALIISSTTIINHERVISILGKNVDIWEIRAKNLGIDNINCLKELKQFQDLCSKTIDEIGTTYGKDKRINVFPIICNSLSIKFGQSIFHKSQNKLLIFDTIKNRKGQVVEKSMLTL